MNEIQINSIRYQLPESWDEVKKNHILPAWLILNDNLTNINNLTIRSEETYLIRIRLVMLFSGLTQATIEDWKELSESFLEEFEQILALLDWIFEVHEEENYSAISIAPTLYACPVSELKLHQLTGEIITLIPPADHMKNCSFGELTNIFNCVENYAADLADGIIESTQPDKLISIIYRPANPAASPLSPDIRIPWVGYEHLAPEREKLLFQVHPVQRDLIMFWARCIHHYFTTSYQNLFEAKQEQDVGNDYGWAGLIMALSPDITRLNEVQLQNAEDTFVWLSYQEDIRKLQEREMKKASK